ncbi:MAG: DedA family protein [Gemmatimonadetes bacterium]|uniref:DedA family protein n=1 Tax=Candidatus Kutchimonas denitrificans TaxID=3056748 RepID=A0AAE5CC30_9BACT|nr:DedA family protein [Gemmatimonadota bacterium]NIR75258.1 DedA family protein [Candidatus Kutchimonas denitrificans]NIS00196.1 DedA family protein [Gemmatimonadota bacterium]NIT65788.1 DedA family protein [Gemmatimonadota bacterium]NIU53066.1 DedA family protein [Gemmatimonadota bacterium]
MVAGLSHKASVGEGARRGYVRRLYDWVLSWAETPYGALALFVLAFIEASFFIVPPDVLLIALCVGQARRSLYFALLCTAGSVLGGVFGYVIGVELYETIGRPIIEFYSAGDAFLYVGEQYRANLVLALGTAGFTPIPYKVFTIAAGAFAVPFLPFVAISAVSRGARFFLVAALIRIWGPRIRVFIDRYFNILTIAFVVALILGFLVLKFVH